MLPICVGKLRWNWRLGVIDFAFHQHRGLTCPDVCTLYFNHSNRATKLRSLFRCDVLLQTWTSNKKLGRGPKPAHECVFPLKTRPFVLCQGVGIKWRKLGRCCPQVFPHHQLCSSAGRTVKRTAVPESICGCASLYSLPVTRWLEQMAGCFVCGQAAQDAVLAIWSSLLGLRHGRMTQYYVPATIIHALTLPSINGSLTSIKSVFFELQKRRCKRLAIPSRVSFSCPCCCARIPT